MLVLYWCINPSQNDDFQQILLYATSISTRKTPPRSTAVVSRQTILAMLRPKRNASRPWTAIFLAIIVAQSIYILYKANSSSTNARLDAEPDAKLDTILRAIDKQKEPPQCPECPEVVCRVPEVTTAKPSACDVFLCAKNKFGFETPLRDVKSAPEKLRKSFAKMPNGVYNWEKLTTDQEVLITQLDKYTQEFLPKQIGAHTTLAVIKFQYFDKLHFTAFFKARVADFSFANFFAKIPFPTACS